MPETGNDGDGKGGPTRIAHRSAIGVVAAGFVILVGLLWWIYTPSFSGGFYYDSKPYIQQSHFFQGGISLSQAMRRAVEPGYHPSSRRVIPNITMAAQTFRYGPQARALRQVNVLLHSVNSLLLFLFLGLVVRRLCPGWSDARSTLCAAAASACWALNALNVDTVAYIVQRAVLLETGFFLLAAILLLRVSERQSFKTALPLLAAMVVCLGAAALSKENAVLFPVTMACVLAFLPGGRRLSTQGRLLLIVVSGTALAAAGTLAIRGLDTGLMGNYSLRNYGPWERLLTEGRVVVHQLVLFFFPRPDSLSLTPHYAISRGLLSPASTLAALLAIIAALAASLLLRRRFPALGLAVTWYLSGHLLESTILPLEIAFPHRSYLPTALAFLPLAVLLFNAGRKAKGALRWAIPALCLLLILAHAPAARARAYVWGDEERFWDRAMKSYPQAILPYLSLSGYYIERGKYDEAIHVVHAALARADLKDDLPRRKAALYANLGLALAETGKLADGIGWLEKALEAFPDELAHLYNLAVLLRRAGRLAEAEVLLRGVVRADPTYPDAQFQLALLLEARGELALAAQLLDRELTLFPQNRSAASARARISARLQR